MHAAAPVFTKRTFSGRLARTSASILLALCIALAGVVATPPFSATPAQAETYRGTAILQGHTELERLTDAFEEAEAQLNEVNEQIAQIEAQIPPAQERAKTAVVAHYKTQNDWISALCALLEADSFGSYLKQLDYIERVSQASMEAIAELHDLQAQAEELKAQITPIHEAASAALRDAQNARSYHQATGTSLAATQAATMGGEASVGVAADGGEQPEDYREAATAETAALYDHADWFASRDDFISHWATRIDAYLEGSPLAGQGANFAQAAWKYNVDPRWSPAISNTESSKGAACIRPHNAWGWGAADADPYGLAFEWGSWEEAIDAHVKGLAEGYGYTISIAGARAYCPNTWQSWYNKTLGEMSRI